MAATFRKHRPDAPRGFFACEAAGLRWLAAAPGGAAVVGVLAVAEDALELERLSPAAPDATAAEELGRSLAATHAAGADAFGAPPDGWEGDGFFGPLDEPLPLLADDRETWGAFQADRRVEQVRDLLAQRGALPHALRSDLDRLADRLRSGDFDDGLAPARLHGDLWSGNVMWTDRGAVLIDPAAHGGHPVTDLAMLMLFGLPHLSRVLDSYQEAADLPDGWRDLVGLHQVYPVGMHAVLFGGGYGAQLAELVRRYG
ncbi:fructosamine kinase family protein [Isoptericola sp. b441]|uniref:Fructosamine kinase family protein n=1 Tax=Actinotalea lenta TaxID=3064654 RepID=A0ABT9DDP5_9CELL|nr:fructosamine kinase family protein [Isoptericola sp. b441]MDO8107546.1 fructosamine kinase family protein [Isoptericola sp. b441]